MGRLYTLAEMDRLYTLTEWIGYKHWLNKKAIYKY